MQDETFKDYILDIFEEFPDIVVKRMFSSWGFYSEGIFFAIVFDGELYFKVDDNNKADYGHVESHAFTYKRKGKDVSLSYWSVPEEILEDKELLFEWAYKSISINAKK
jgi:DNA transformation protein